MDLLKRTNFEEEIVSQNVKKRLFQFAIPVLSMDFISDDDFRENHRSIQPYEKALSNDRDKTTLNRKKLLKTFSGTAAVIVSGEGKLSIASIQLTLLFLWCHFII